MGDSQFLEIVILAMLAGFIFLRLRSALGRRTGTEKRPKDLFSKGADGQPVSKDSVVRLPNGERTKETIGTASADLEPALAASLTQISLADPSFEIDSFANGARAAFEMIVTSYANGDLDALRPLVNDEVYGNFEAALRARVAKGESAETTLLGIKSGDIVGAAVRARIAEVTVRFVSEMLTIVRDKDGTIVSGDSRSPQTVVDLWTFARSTKSSDPNWTLIATRTPH